MRIAIIGAGISGMVSAYLLCRNHDITVYEANAYIGGHTHTVDVDLKKTVYPVDTGFIVFNKATYPNFVKLLKELNVPWKPSRMSFSVRCEKTGLEYSPSSFNALFAQRHNLFRPAFLRMIMDIFRFRKGTEALLATADDDITLGQYLESKGYSQAFIQYFIIPMGAAIWSADPDRFHEFPARYFVGFFKNHGFLKLKDQPQWLVIQGGSKKYVEKLTAPYRDQIRLNRPVRSICRHEDHVELRLDDGAVQRFDHCVVATHSDQALSMLSDPTDAETEILGAIGYQENFTILHTDASILPRRRSCWASWNYRIPRQARDRVTVTYNMNILQSLEAPVEFCVTLNSDLAINPASEIKKITYHHPVYTPQALSAQKRFNEISGLRRTHFCGAYWGYGFHEDGVNSALAACEYFGERL